MSIALRPARLAVGLMFIASRLSSPAAPSPASHDYPFQPVPFTAVHLTDAFWAPRLETNRLTTIPYAFRKCEESGRMHNFERAAAVLRGENISDRKPPGFPFDDTDPYKVLEGASYSLAVHPDPKMAAYLDELIALIASAQEPDGYLYTTRTIDPQHPHEWSGTNRWVKEQDLSHELYDAGHLFEAAVAHHEATGETNLLEVAIREANLLCNTFGPATDQLHLWPGHEIVEMGLAKLYRFTGDERFLDLAKYFIDVRGSHPGGDDYHQSRLPPVDQTEATGHAVRAGYLYSGMADVAALTGNTNYLHAIDLIWENCVGKKFYVTGGIGSRPDGEAFGGNYELPNLTAYNETCAAVANVYWNERLYLLHGEAKYVDVFERTLYNGLLAGVSLDGTKFFYPNPLESDGNYERSAWFGCACCPGNITRFLPSLPGCFYAQKNDSIFVNLFASGVAGIKLNDGRAIKLTQKTRYPWDGAVKITVAPEHSSRFTIAVRIPGWAQNEAVPGGLYEFLIRSANEPVTLKVNGRKVPLQLDQGYVRLDRRWKNGDVIRLDLPMPVQEVVASQKVRADHGRIALQRGPIVFCGEWADNPGGKVRNLILPRGQEFSPAFEPSLLNGVETISGKSVAVSKGADGGIVKTEQPFKAIPYFAWANRGKGEMAVWFADSEGSSATP
ncbi:MAG: glycoside hydrolase family 127 protein [Verrucomicrobiota bacterium]